MGQAKESSGSLLAALAAVTPPLQLGLACVLKYLLAGPLGADRF